MWRLPGSLQVPGGTIETVLGDIEMREVAVLD
jgi:hypothetical protein